MTLINMAPEQAQSCFSIHWNYVNYVNGSGHSVVERMYTLGLKLWCFENEKNEDVHGSSPGLDLPLGKCQRFGAPKLNTYKEMSKIIYAPIIFNFIIKIIFQMTVHVSVLSL